MRKGCGSARCSAERFAVCSEFHCSGLVWLEALVGVQFAHDSAQKGRKYASQTGSWLGSAWSPRHVMERESLVLSFFFLPEVLSACQQSQCCTDDPIFSAHTKQDLSHHSSWLRSKQSPLMCLIHHLSNSLTVAGENLSSREADLWI